MRVSKSFAESLMDAVMQGRVPGMQFKRNWDILANMGQTWDAITNIVGDHLQSVREAAHEQGLSAARDYATERDRATKGDG